MKYKDFIDMLAEGVTDVTIAKRKRIADRTPREQAAIDAAKKQKPLTGKADVHRKYENGAIIKHKFTLKKSPDEWHDEAEKHGNDYIKMMQDLRKYHPNSFKDAIPVAIHKIVVK